MKYFLSITIGFLVTVSQAQPIEESTFLEVYDVYSSELQKLAEQRRKVEVFQKKPIVEDLDEIVEVYREIDLFSGDWNCSGDGHGLQDYYDCALETLGFEPVNLYLGGKRQIIIDLVFREIALLQKAVQEDLGSDLESLYVRDLFSASTSINDFHSLLCHVYFKQSQKTDFIESQKQSLKTLSAGNKYLLSTFLDYTIDDKSSTKIDSFCGEDKNQHISKAYLQ